MPNAKQEISERAAERLRRTSAAFVTAYAQYQLVAEVIAEAYCLPGPIVGLEGNHVIYAAPDGD